MDFIKEGWEDFVKLDFSRQVAQNADKIIKECESNVEYYQEQWVANVLPYANCILIKAGEAYQWHFDNLNWKNGQLTMPRNNRYYSEITYLTDGTPLQIGNFNASNDRVYQTEFSAPRPTDIIAEIWPEPGKRVIFPSFVVHRVISPTKDRWAIVRWIDTYENKNSYASLWKRYFGHRMVER